MRLTFLGSRDMHRSCKLQNCSKVIAIYLKKLKCDDLVESNDRIFKEWLRDGVIKRVTETQYETHEHYLPHRSVINESSATTRIRPVFDASAQEDKGPFLNHCLENGSNLIIIRFCCNLENMQLDLCQTYAKRFCK